MSEYPSSHRPHASPTLKEGSKIQAPSSSEYSKSKWGTSACGSVDTMRHSWSKQLSIDSVSSLKSYTLHSTRSGCSVIMMRLTVCWFCSPCHVSLENACLEPLLPDFYCHLAKRYCCFQKHGIYHLHQLAEHLHHLDTCCLPAQPYCW